MDTSLGAVLSDATEQPSEAQVVEQTGVDQVPPTSEGTEPERQEDPVEHRVKGLESAVAAERRKRQEAEQRVAQYEETVRKYLEAQQPQKPQPQDGRPKRDQYASQEEYEDALLEYGDKRREAREAEARQQREEVERAQELARTADEVVSRGQKAYADFDQAINANLGPLLAQNTPAAGFFRQALLSGDRAHDVAYFLAKNPDEAQRVYALPPLQMVRALSLIEATKLQTTEDERPALPRTLTQARDSRTGQFQPKYEGPTPLNDILARKA